MSKEKHAGAAYNALMEEETKESLVRMVLDGFDALREARGERDTLQTRGDMFSNLLRERDGQLAAEREARKQAEVDQLEVFRKIRDGARLLSQDSQSRQCPSAVLSVAQQIEALADEQIPKPVPATSQPPSQPTGGGE